MSCSSSFLPSWRFINNMWWVMKYPVIPKLMTIHILATEQNSLSLHPYNLQPKNWIHTCHCHMPLCSFTSTFAHPIVSCRFAICSLSSCHLPPPLLIYCCHWHVITQSLEHDRWGTICAFAFKQAVARTLCRMNDCILWMNRQGSRQTAQLQLSGGMGWRHRLDVPWLGIELKEAIDRPLKERKKEGGNAGVLALLIALAGSQGRSFARH